MGKFSHFAKTVRICKYVIMPCCSCAPHSNITTTAEIAGLAPNLKKKSGLSTIRRICPSLVPLSIHMGEYGHNRV